MRRERYTPPEDSAYDYLLDSEHTLTPDDIDGLEDGERIETTPYNSTRISVVIYRGDNKMQTSNIAPASFQRVIEELSVTRENYFERKRAQEIARQEHERDEKEIAAKNLERDERSGSSPIMPASIASEGRQILPTMDEQEGEFVEEPAEADQELEVSDRGLKTPDDIWEEYVESEEVDEDEAVEDSATGI